MLSLTDSLWVTPLPCACLRRVILGIRALCDVSDLFDVLPFRFSCTSRHYNLMPTLEAMDTTDLLFCILCADRLQYPWGLKCMLAAGRSNWGQSGRQCGIIQDPLTKACLRISSCALGFIRFCFVCLLASFSSLCSFPSILIPVISFELTSLILQIEAPFDRYPIDSSEQWRVFFIQKLFISSPLQSGPAHRRMITHTHTHTHACVLPLLIGLGVI